MNDIRLGDLMESSPIGYDRASVVLIGFPSDIGVERNGGRAGAAQAPSRLREHLRKFTPHPEHAQAHMALLKTVHDAGDLELSGRLEDDQQMLGTAVAKALNDHKRVIVLGGGHETTYGHFLAYADSRRSVSLLNRDAHPDIRPLRDGEGHSGSPFRQALEHPSEAATDYTVAGLQPQSVAPEHLEYLRGKRASYFWSNEIDEVAVRGIYTGVVVPTMVSVDMDVVDQAFAPGVSAPNPRGINPGVLCEVGYQAGLSRFVDSFDVVEMNPLYDADGRTARLAALCVWWFTVGLALRDAADAGRSASS